MKASSLNEIKDELKTLPAKALLDLCMRMAKYKKENKELLTYLLFEAHDEEAYIKEITVDCDQLFREINKSNIYYAKKSIRKILRILNKYSKYSGQKRTEVELLIYFLKKVKSSGIQVQKSTALLNLYNRQILRIRKALKTMHEDLQHDYNEMLEPLILSEK